MLKPALARGLQLAGGTSSHPRSRSRLRPRPLTDLSLPAHSTATTLEEYRRTIEKDAALTRRFQPVLIEEPSVEQTITMLRGLKSKYEIHHSVSIADSALVTAAVASNRYISERQLPDKAIDLIDEACSAVRLARESKPPALESIEHHITELQIELSSLGRDTDDVSLARREVIAAELAKLESEAKEMERTWREERNRGEEIKKAREELEAARWGLEEAQRRGEFDRASRLRYETIPELVKKIPSEGVKAKGEEQEGARVTSDDVARVVAKVRSPFLSPSPSSSPNPLPD